MVVDIFWQNDIRYLQNIKGPIGLFFFATKRAYAKIYDDFLDDVFGDNFTDTKNNLSDSFKQELGLESEKATDEVIEKPEKTTAKPAKNLKDATLSFGTLSEETVRLYDTEVQSLYGLLDNSPYSPESRNRLYSFDQSVYMDVTKGYYNSTEYSSNNKPNVESKIPHERFVGIQNRFFPRY